MRAVAAMAVVAALVAMPSPALGQGEPDCTGPAGDPAPGTPEWDRREDDNVFCASQRNSDTASNPAYQQALLEPRPPGRDPAIDPFREPTRWNGRRFRFEEVRFADAAGKEFPGMLFRPCDESCRDMPAGLQRFEPSYPGVVVMHGGAANQEMYLWGAEGLAEAGYMVLTLSIGRGDDTHYEDTKTALGWFTSGENPRRSELNVARLGLAGHSAGGVAVSRLGQEDPRVSAIVSWDRAQSGPMPPDLRLRVPALFLTADFNCQRVPVCLPERRPQPVDPHGPGNKDEDFQRVSAAGVDTMKVSLRAATHLDFTEFPQANGSRYGVVTALYYTLAWFDRYVKGSPEAVERLTAARFDESADVHNISGGRADPQTGANLPARIAGQPVADRLSFHFRSAWFLDGGRHRCEDIRAGCAGVSAALGRPRLRLRIRYRGRTCARRRVMLVGLTGPDAAAVRRVVVRHRGRVVGRGTRVARLRLQRLRRSGALSVDVTLADGRRAELSRRLVVCGKRR
jgi:dienelactone hydrolase